MDNEEIKPLLVKYITGETTDDDISVVKEWINAHPENEQYFAQLYETWHNTLYVQILNKDNAFQQISPTRVKASLRFARWGKGAAAIAAAVMLGVLLLHHYPEGPGKTKQIIAAKGAIQKIVLSDGTVVWLNAGSRLDYANNFGKKSRTVYLEGEAFFEIAPGKTNLPFIVNTRKYTIRDIGTKFNLKAYPNDSFFETTVVKGEVSVEGNRSGNSRENNRIYVKPSQVLRIYYRPENDRYVYKAYKQDSATYNEIQVLQVDSAKLNQYDGWKDDLLVFDGNTLDEISKVLERRYAVNITMNDTDLKRIRYSGSFKNVASINEVLDIIKSNTPIEYSITGNTVYITNSKK